MAFQFKLDLVYLGIKFSTHVVKIVSFVLPLEIGKGCVIDRSYFIINFGDIFKLRPPSPEKQGAQLLRHTESTFVLRLGFSTSPTRKKHGGRGERVVFTACEIKDFRLVGNDKTAVRPYESKNLTRQ